MKRKEKNGPKTRIGVSSLRQEEGSCFVSTGYSAVQGIASPVFGRESTRTGSAQHSAHAFSSQPPALALLSQQLDEQLSTLGRSTRPWTELNSFYFCVIVPRVHHSAWESYSEVTRRVRIAIAADQRMNAGCCMCCTLPPLSSQ